MEPLLPSTSRWRWIVLGVLALALALRVGVVVDDHSTYRPLSDAKHFDDIATEIADGGAWGIPLPPAHGPSAVRAPGYPAFLAAIYVVAGDHSWTAARVANAFLGLGTVALIGLIAAQLLGRRTGFVALCIAAVHPALALVGSGLQLEPLLTILCLGAAAAVLQHRRRPSGLRWPIVAGACLGGAALTRELGFLFVPSLAWLLWQARPADLGRWTRKALLAPVSMLVVTVLLLVPWTVRNYLRLDALVPTVTTSAGFGLVGTYNQTAADNRAQWVRPYDDPHLQPILFDLFEDEADEIEVNDVLTEETIEYATDHPGYIPKVAFWNTVRLFDLDGGDYSRFIARFLPYPDWLTRLSIVAGYGVLGLAILGLFARRHTRRVPLALWLIPVFIYVFMVITLPASIRYRASMEPFFILAAAGALVGIYDRWLELTAEPEPEPAPVAATTRPRRREPLRRPS